MSFNKKQTNTILNFILLFILAYFIYYQYNIDKFENSKPTINDSNYSKTCTLNINDLDHRTLDDYNKFDGQIAKCGECNDAVVKMNINTCATDANGSPVSGCSPNGPVGNIDKVTNLNNMVYKQNVIFNNKANPGNIKTFFCFE